MSYVQLPNRPQKGLHYGYLFTILSGLLQTTKVLIKQLLRLEKTVALEYPEQKHQYSPRFKGIHYLTKHPDGRVRCTACYLCATNCPAECIEIVAAESDDKTVEKYPTKFNIDLLRCVFCGYCEEACPLDAIRMGPEVSAAGLNGDNFILSIDDLLNRPAIKEIVGEKQISRVP